MSAFKHIKHICSSACWKQQQNHQLYIISIPDNIQSALINSNCSHLIWRGHESWENSHANSRSSTLMQLLFSFDWGIRVEKTLMQTLASQLSCNFCSRLTGAWELRKLSCKLSPVNSHQLSCNSCSRLTGVWELRKLSCKLSLLNSHQLSCNSYSRLTGAWELRKLSCKLSLLNSYLIQTLIYLIFYVPRLKRNKRSLCSLHDSSPSLSFFFFEI
jgi:hypothetical protein